MEKQTYNGWTNWETWNANLWIDNDWRMSESYAMQAGDLIGSYDQDEATERLAEIIESDFEEFMPEAEGFFADAISMAMREVNWQEIACHYVQEAVNENEEENAEAE